MENKETKFNSLTPDILEENKQVYTDALNYAFSNDDIRNIAITGVYGAGKSTVWNTYKNNKLKERNFNLFRINPFKNVITVVLGKYSDKLDKNNSEPLSKNELDSRVETQIINQILSQIKAEDIPLSKYKFKGNISLIKLFLNILLTIFFIGSISIFVIRKEIVEILNKKLEWLNILLLSISGMIVISVGVFLYHFYKENKVKFSKVNFKVAEAQFSDDNNDETVLERDMREIVYLLSSSKSNIVVFEDLDRYDNVDIFIKLKELNFLLNSYLEINEKNRIVRFVYLIKDGLFHTKDRTKFFDFILPIIPVVDSNTSEGHLLSLLDVENENQEVASEQNTALKRNVLRNISLYIDDMRVLRNIVNEYKVYTNILRVSDTKLDENKLFALITIKNIYPNDFDLLKENKGYISRNFKKLEDYRSSKIDDTKNKLSNCVIDIEKFNNIFENSKFEVLASGIPSYIRLDPSEEKSWAIFLKKWSENKTIRKSIYHNNGSNMYDYEDFLKYFIDEIDEKIKLGEELSENRETKLNRLKKEKVLLERQLDEIKLYTFRELLSIMTSEELEKIFECDEGEENQEYTLIRYLLIEGLFDETYWYYNGNFDDVESNTLKPVDRIYMRRLLEKSEENVLLEIDSPNEILNRLVSSDFKRVNILNYKLLEACVRRTNCKKNSSEDVLNMLASVEINETYSDLVKIFEGVQFDTTRYCVNLLIAKRIDILKEVVKICDNTHPKALNNITLSILLNNEISTNDFEEFRSVVENNEHLLEEFKEKKHDDFLSSIKSKNIKFEDLQKIELSEDNLIQIINENAYRLSIKNLMFIAKKITKGNAFDFNLLSVIFSDKNLKQCWEYINSNFDEVVSEYLEQYDGKFQFIVNKDIFKKIIESNISLELKRKFIKSVMMSLHQIDDLNQKLINIQIIEELFNNKKVKYNTKNTKYYWELIMQDSEKLKDKKDLIDNFIKNFNKQFYTDKTKDQEEKEKIFQELVDICNIIINNNNVGKDLFEIIIKYATERIEKLNADLQIDKIKELVNRNMIVPNEDNIKILINKSLNEEIKLIAENYENEVLPILRNMELSDETIYSVVNSNISVDNAKSLITNLNESVQIDKISPEKTKLIEYIKNKSL